ncbi:MAG: aminodeoxychorismate lyase [Bacillota bacterium]|nr:aminodeoxychorismate lyase [Bacillota bacterium]
MNKRGLRAFSFGIIFTISMLGSYYYTFNKQPVNQLNQKNAKALLQKNGYVILSESEFSKIKKNTVPNKAVPKRSETQNSKKQQVTPPPNPTTSNVTYRLQVVSGMTSEEIAHILAEQKIIENEREFQSYLITHNYHTKVQLGSYDLTNKMDYSQIAKTITKTK